MGFLVYPDPVQLKQPLTGTSNYLNSSNLSMLHYLE